MLDTRTLQKTIHYHATLIRTKVCTIQKRLLYSQRRLDSGEAETGLESALDMHLLRDEVGCWHCVDRIGQVIGINNDGVFADQVQSEAVGVDIAFGDVGKWSAFEGIPEDNLSHRINRFVQENQCAKFTHHSNNPRRNLRTNHRFPQMHHLSPLTIPAQHNLRIRALTRSLLEQLRRRSGSSWISSL